VSSRFRPSLPGALAQWWRRLGALLTLAGLGALALLFLRYERTPLLGSRAWMVGWFTVAAVALSRLLWQRARSVPAAVAAEERERRLRRYLP
jgi:hypothetical protein